MTTKHETASQLELVDVQAVEQPRALATQAMTPDQMLGLVVQRGAPLDEVERYMALYERWQDRQALALFNAAVAGFKSESVKIIKNKTVSDGPMKGGRYADLFAVVDAVTPALSKHGLKHGWKLTKDDSDWMEVTCTLSHIDGHSESVSMGGPPDKTGAKNPIQSRASTKSYLERYTLLAILGLAAQGEDNDGNGAGPAADDPAVAALQEAGEAAAMNGMRALTAWWAKLDRKQQSLMNKPFAAMRKAAAAADAGVKHDQ